MRHRNCFKRNSFFCGAASAIAVSTLLSGTALAAWDVIPDVGTFIESSDNLQLRTEGSQDGTLALLDARVLFTNRGQRGVIRVEPRILKDTYAEEINSDLESDDRYLRSSGNYNWQAASVGFNADFAQQNIRRAEISDPFFTNTDVDDPIEEDEPTDVSTGQLAGIDQNRNRGYLNTYLNLNISDRNSFRFDARKIDLSYSDFEVSGRTSFDDTTFGVGIVRRVDERNRVSARIFKSTYEAAENENITDTVGVEGIFSRPLSETWTMRITAGVQRADFVFRDQNTLELVDNADSNFLGNLRFRSQTERNSIIVDVGRRLTPNASGYVVLRDEIRFHFTRRLTERVSGGLAFRASETASLDDVNTNDDRTFARFQAFLDVAMTPRLYFQIGIDRIRQRFVNSEVDVAEANSIRIGVFYRAQPRF